MPGEIATIPRLRFYGATGAPLAGGTLTVYLTGTTTKTSTWQDQALTIFNTNPIVLDGNGSCVVWVDSTKTYKIVLADKNGVVQWTQSNIVGGGVDTSVEITAALLQAALDEAQASADAAAQSLADFQSYYEIDVLLAQLTAFFFGEVTDYRGDTVPNSYRRVLEYRREIGSTRVYEVVAEKSVNSTAVGYVLRYLCAVGSHYSIVTHAYLELINRLANLCVAMQHVDARKARYGGFALAPKDGTASAYNAGMVGLGLIAAYRLTLDPRLLESCQLAATFLGTLNNPNPVYSALYGVTPIPAVSQNAEWNGFCDQISAGDTILTTHTTWNLLASKFLKELYDVTNDTAYQTLYQNTRDWGASGVTGFYDFWTVYQSGALPSYVSNNWSATGLTVSDGQWHRRGEATPSGVINSGACTAATATTITLALSASSDNDFYVGNAIKMTSGASINKGSVIIAYDGATRVATLKYGFPTTPSAADTYTIGLSVNTIGSDQMEYGIESLYDTNYTLASIKTAYETIRSWANADTGPFGIAYDSRVCWTGFFRPYAQVYSGVSKAFGTQYDVQGIGPLLKFKKDHYPADYAVSLAVGKNIPNVATLLNKDFQTIWSTDATGLFEFTTVGIGTVKGSVGLGIVESLDA